MMMDEHQLCPTVSCATHQKVHMWPPMALGRLHEASGRLHVANSCLKNGQAGGWGWGLSAVGGRKLQNQLGSAEVRVAGVQCRGHSCGSSRVEGSQKGKGGGDRQVGGADMHPVVVNAG